MVKRKLPKRPKSHQDRLEELSSELIMLQSDIQNFERTKQNFWIRSIAGRLHKLIVRRNQNTPLLMDLADTYDYPLVVYISFMLVARQSRFNTTPSPIFSMVIDPLSSTPDDVHPYQKPLSEALKLDFLLFKGETISYEELLILIRDTESAHSDIERPELLDTVDLIDFSGTPGTNLYIYQLSKIIYDIGNQFIVACKHRS